MVNWYVITFTQIICLYHLGLVFKSCWIFLSNFLFILIIKSLRFNLSSMILFGWRLRFRVLALSVKILFEFSFWTTCVISQSFLGWNFNSLEMKSLLLFLEKKIFLSVGLRIKSSGVVLFAWWKLCVCGSVTRNKGRYLPLSYF